MIFILYARIHEEPHNTFIPSNACFCDPKIASSVRFCRYRLIHSIYTTESIDLRGTSFIGKVPEELCEQETIDNIFIDCNMIECSGDCCSTCDSARADIDIDSAITQASPTDAPIASPTDAPIDCGLPLSCLGCLQQDCYYGNGGGMGSCHNCKHQKEQCNGKTGFCNIFPDNDGGRLQCISYIKETCPGDR